MLDLVNARGLLAARPAAAASNKGYTYSASDGDLYRSNGVSWDTIAASPPVAASQAEMEAGTEAALRSVSPLRVAQAIAALSGGGEGGDWSAVTKSANQDVVNSTTFTDDTELQLVVVAGKVYRVRMVLLYSGSAAAVDYKCRMLQPVDVWALIRYHHITTADGNGALASAYTGNAGAALGTQFDLGTGASHAVVRSMFWEAEVVAIAGGTLKWQFANVTAGAGNTSRTHAGSRLEYELLN